MTSSVSVALRVVDAGLDNVAQVLPPSLEY